MSMQSDVILAACVSRSSPELLLLSYSKAAITYYAAIHALRSLHEKSQVYIPPLAVPSLSAERAVCAAVLESKVE